MAYLVTPWRVASRGIICLHPLTVKFLLSVYAILSQYLVICSVYLTVKSFTVGPLSLIASYCQSLLMPLLRRYRSKINTRWHRSWSTCCRLPVGF